MPKRLFDLLASATGLLVLSPMLMALAMMIKMDSKGPVFFRQQRIGLHGKPFRIHKFRTMVTDAERGSLQITIGNDKRITKVGSWMRQYKLDELPQLIDVLTGSMSLVGPRPEVPKYVQYYPEQIKEIIFSVRPGVTDLASITFRSENEILAQSDNPEKAYIETVLPEKLKCYVEYVRTRTLIGDIALILKTIGVLGRY